jgi:hypothetical protein
VSFAERLIFKGFPNETIERNFEVAGGLFERLGVTEPSETEMGIVHGSLLSFA